MKFRRTSMQFRSRHPGSGLDLTPMVDIVFNLLIFFALSLNFIVSGGINIKLPKSSSAKPIKRENITINLSKDGKIYYNDDELSSVNQVRKQLQRHEYKESIVVIKADREVQHGKVVEVMDMAKSEGFSKLFHCR